MSDNTRLTEEQMERILRDAAAAYNPPPETPAEAMWARIEAERGSGREAEGRQRERRAVGRPTRFPAWQVAAAIAAVLVVGIVIGRFTAPNGAPQAGTEAAATGLTPDVSPTAPVNSVAYQVAASEHLRRVETFLTVFRADARAGRLRGDEHVGPARSLLLSTRLLRDTPATEDLTLRTLLEDLEVVLAQIAQYTGDRDDELGFIDQGIEQRSVLLKLRSANAGGARQAASQGAL